MKPLDWCPEPVAATGGINGQGVLRQLGRPAMDMAELLVREAIQNSWDARCPHSTSIEFRVHGRQLSPEQQSILNQFFFHGAFSNEAPSNQQIWLPTSALLIQDKGTYGLSGEIRPDRDFGSTVVPPNFIRFLRNVGQTHTGESTATGGTYGFGKASYYLFSRISMIIVHSRCFKPDGSIESRLIASRLGDEFIMKGKRYTGRQWWGHAADDGVADPLVGDEADDTARLLGIPVHSSTETGTSILVLEPDFANTPAEALLDISKYVIRSFWPKLIDGPGKSPSINFSIGWEDQEFALAHNRPALETFRRAFERASKLSTEAKISPFFSTVPIMCLKPHKFLGTLCMFRFEDSTELGDKNSILPFEGDCHHVALMRSPHFVVRYLTQSGFSKGQWAGVFVADPSLDSCFATSEPPTHDMWNPQQLPTRSQNKKFVNLALQNIKKAIQEFSAPGGAGTHQGRNIVPLGAFADEMGSLVPAVIGTGGRTPLAPTSPAPSARRPNPAQRATARILNQQLVLWGGKSAVKVEFSTHFASGFGRIRARAEVITDDGRPEGAISDGLEAADVIAWNSAEGTSEFSPLLEDGASGTVHFSCPRDCRIRVSLTAEDQAP